MIAFANPRDAPECARALHSRAAELSERVALGDRVLLRIGIHAAEVLTDDVAFYGHGVNVAARLAALAGPGETVISAAVREQLTAGPGGARRRSGSVPPQAYRRTVASVPAGTGQRAAARHRNAVRDTADVGGHSVHAAKRWRFAPQSWVRSSPTRLSSHFRVRPELRVVSRLSTTAFRGRKTQLDNIRALLGATYVLSGAYRVSGDTLIVTVELADTRDREIVWAQRFKSRLGGLLAQDDPLVASIVAGVAGALMNTEIRRTKSRALPTLDAYTLLLGGIGLMHRLDPQAFAKSRQAFEQLIERYPRYAAPYAYLAEWHVFKVTQGWFTDLERESGAALGWINRALDIDTGDSLAQMVNGLVHANLLHRHDVAEVSYDLALENNASDGLARLHRGTLWAFRDAGMRRSRKRIARSNSRRSIRGATTTTRCARPQRWRPGIMNARSSWRGVHFAPIARMPRPCA